MIFLAGAISENITIHPKREPSISMYYASEGFPPREDFSITFQLGIISTAIKQSLLEPKITPLFSPELSHFK